MILTLKRAEKDKLPMKGLITKGIGGFYYVYVEGNDLYECRAKGIFRNRKMKPNVGDYVEIDVISEEEKTGNLSFIKKRKNQKHH